MKNIIEHLEKLLECDDFIITGSFALHLYGLCEKVQDLDIILYKPTEKTMGILQLLNTKDSDEYPDNVTQFQIIINKTKIDCFCVEKQEHYMYVKFGEKELKLAIIKNIIAAKKKYKKWKHIIQLKNLADFFLSEREFLEFLTVEKNKQATPCTIPLSFFKETEPVPFKNPVKKPVKKIYINNEDEGEEAED